MMVKSGDRAGQIIFFYLASCDEFLDDPRSTNWTIIILQKGNFLPENDGQW